MVSKLSKNELLAQAFVTEFLASDEIMMELYKAQFGIPAWLPTREEVMNPDIEGFSASVANGDPMPAIPEMASVWTIGNNVISLIYQQKKDPEAAMKEAATALRDEIGKEEK
jgi:maltose-binding protein MalE